MWIMNIFNDQREVSLPLREYTLYRGKSLFSHQFPEVTLVPLIAQTRLIYTLQQFRRPSPLLFPA